MGLDSFEGSESVEINKFYFGTQAQGVQEEWDLEEEQRSKLSTLASQFALSEFDSIPKNSTPQLCKSRKRTPAVKKVPPKKKAKIRSLTNQMTKKYITSNKNHNISVLLALSGKKQKLKDIFKRIQSIEEDQKIQVQSDITPVDDKQISILYSKEEWKSVLKAISNNFPKLSKDTKKTLDFISDLYSQRQSDSSLGLWDQSSQPPLVLTKDEIHYLYDFNSDEKSFLQSQGDDTESNPIEILTLSQVMETGRSLNASIASKEKELQSVDNSSIEIIDDDTTELGSDSDLIDIQDTEIECSYSEGNSGIITWDLVNRMSMAVTETAAQANPPTRRQNSIFQDSINDGDLTVESNSDLNQLDNQLESIFISPLKSSLSDLGKLGSDSQLLGSQLQNGGSSANQITQTEFNTQLTNKADTQKDPKASSSFQHAPITEDMKTKPIPFIRTTTDGVEIQVLESMNQNSVQLTSLINDSRLKKNQSDSVPVSTSAFKTSRVEIISSSPLSSPTSKKVTSSNPMNQTQDVNSSPLRNQFESPKKVGNLGLSPLKKSINQLPDEFNESKKKQQREVVTELHFEESFQRRDIEILSENEYAKETVLDSVDDNIFKTVFGVQPKVGNEEKDVFEIPDSSEDENDEGSMMLKGSNIHDFSGTRISESFEPQLLTHKGLEPNIDPNNSIVQVPSSPEPLITLQDTNKRSDNSDDDDDDDIESDIFVSCPEYNFSEKRKEIDKIIEFSQADSIPAPPSLDYQRVNEIPDSQSSIICPSSPVTREGIPDPSSSQSIPDIDFDKYSTRQLKQQISEWGLKPVRSRAQMICLLESTLKLIDKKHLIASLENREKNASQAQTQTQNQSQGTLLREEDDCDSGVAEILRFSQTDLNEGYITMQQEQESSRVVRRSIFARIREIIKNNEEMYFNVMLFKPVNLKSVADLLVTNGIDIEVGLVADCLDELGICFTEVVEKNTNTQEPVAGLENDI